MFYRFVVLLSLLAFCVSCNASRSKLDVALDPSSIADMEYIDVCDRQNICKKFSRLVLGTDHLVQANWRGDGQAEMTEDEVNAVLNEALRLGINFIDTAPIYVGGVENKIGKWYRNNKDKIQSNEFYYKSNFNPDRQLYVLSKGGFPFDLYWAKRLDRGTHSEEFMSQARKSSILKTEKINVEGGLDLSNVPPGTYASRLFGNESQITRRISEEITHTETNLGGPVAIYLMHRDDNDFFMFNDITRKQTPVKSIMRALSNKQLTSKYWQIGWSNWHTPRVEESIKLANSDATLHKPVINSPYFSLFEMSTRSIHAGGVQVTHAEMMDSSFQRGIKLMTYSPLGGFSIMDKPEPRWENGKKAAKAAKDQGDPYWQNVYDAVFTSANQARYERVVSFTRDFNESHNTNYTVDQMINAYALAHKRTDFLAIGPTTIEQLRRTAAALRLSKMLTESDLKYLYEG